MKIDVNKKEAGMMVLWDQDHLNKLRVAGKVAADALSLLVDAVASGTKMTEIQLSKMAEDYIVSKGCKATFKGYKGFPEAVCISVNKTLVHGVPRNKQLVDGDVITFDLGATFEGMIGDTATTCIYGSANREHEILANATKLALKEAIKKIKIGKRLGIIGETIYKIGKSNGLSVVHQYGGHGIGVNKPHSFPFVSNKDSEDNGIRFQSGMTLCLEPLFVLGNDNFTYIAEDNWSVNCRNICAHEEHTVFVHDDGVEILTERQGR